MADASIIVEVKETGARVVKRSLDGVTDSGERADRVAGALKTAFIALGGVAVVRSLTRLSDTFTVLETGLKNVTDSQAEANVVFADLFDIAQRDGSSIDGLAETYTKLNVVLTDSVADATDLVKVTELLSRGFAASGAAANTAAGATLQLTQGLATNFQAAGQELNSIIEGAPLLAKAIAVELGGNGAADLKIFAEQGRITSETFLQALIRAEDAIKSFEIPPTIGRSVQRLENSFLKLIGQSTAVQGVTGGIATSLDSLARNLDTVINVVIAFAGVHLVRYVATMVTATTTTTAFNVVMGTTVVRTNTLIASMSALRGVLLTIVGGPLGLFTVAIGGAVLAIKALNGENKLVADSQAAYNETLRFATSLTGNYIGASEDRRQQLRLETKETIENIELQLKAFAALAEEFNRLSRIERAGTRLQGFFGFGPDVDELEEIARGQFENLESLKQQLDSFEEIDRTSRGADVAVEALSKTTGTLADETDRLKDVATDAFTDFVTGATSAEDALKQLGRQLIELASKEIFGSDGGSSGLGGLISGALGAAGSFFGGGNSIGQSVGSIFSSSPTGPFQLPAFNDGGSFTIGGNGGVDNNLLSINGSPAAMVGRGEQVNITPAGQSGSGGVTINQNINISTGVQQTVRAEILQMLPIIERQTTQAAQEAESRRLN